MTSGLKAGLGLNKPSDEVKAALAQFQRNPPQAYPQAVFVKIVSGANLPTDPAKENIYHATFGINKDVYMTDKVTNAAGAPMWDKFSEFPVKSSLEVLNVKVYHNDKNIGSIRVAVWDMPVQKGEQSTFKLTMKAASQRKLGSEVSINCYFLKSAMFQLPQQSDERERLVKDFVRICKNTKDIILVRSGAAAAGSGGGGGLGANMSVSSMGTSFADPNLPYIESFFPTQGPCNRRTKITINGNHFGRSRAAIKSVTVCGQDVTGTLDHINSAKIKVTTSFWNAGPGLICIQMATGEIIESEEMFEFVKEDDNKFVAFNKTATSGGGQSATALYKPSNPQFRSNSTTGIGGGSGGANTLARGNYDFSHFEQVARQGNAADLRIEMQELIRIAKLLQERLNSYLKYTEDLLIKICSEAPELLMRDK